MSTLKLFSSLSISRSSLFKHPYQIASANCILEHYAS